MGSRRWASDGEEEEVGDAAGNSRRLDIRIRMRSGMRREMGGGSVFLVIRGYLNV